MLKFWHLSSLPSTSSEELYTPFCFFFQAVTVFIKTIPFVGRLLWKHIQASYFTLFTDEKNCMARVHNIIWRISFSCLSANCAQVLTELFPITKRKEKLLIIAMSEVRKKWDWVQVTLVKPALIILWVYLAVGVTMVRKDNGTENKRTGQTTVQCTLNR